MIMTSMYYPCKNDIMIFFSACQYKRLLLYILLFRAESKPFEMLSTWSLKTTISLLGKQTVGSTNRRRKILEELRGGLKKSKNRKFFKQVLRAMREESEIVREEPEIADWVRNPQSWNIFIELFSQMYVVWNIFSDYVCRSVFKLILKDHTEDISDNAQN